MTVDVSSIMTKGLVDNAMNQASISRINNMASELYSSKTDNSSVADKVKKSAQDFEAVFITQMLQHMFEGIETDPVFGGGSAEETFRTFLFDEYGKTLSKAGGVGVSKNVQDELLRLQEVAK